MINGYKHCIANLRYSFFFNLTWGIHLVRTQLVRGRVCRGGGGDFAYFCMYGHIINCIRGGGGGGSKMAKTLPTYYLDTPVEWDFICWLCYKYNQPSSVSNVCRATSWQLKFEGHDIF